MANEFNIKNGFISNGDGSVNGKLTTQNLTITSGATNGYVLTSDVSGNATWQVPSVTGDTNFANTNLTFNGNRTHNTNQNYLWIQTNGTVSGGTIYMDSVNWVDVGFSTSNTNANYTRWLPTQVEHYYDNISRLRLSNSETVINETGGDYDLRVEGDTDTNLFFVDASTNRIGIGESSPSEKLDINGKTKTISFQMTSGATNGYVLTSDASGNAIWSSIYKKETVNIDSATILGTLSTGGTIQLLPAPSVGKYYDWHAFVKYTYGTVAYNNSGAGSWYVEQGGADLAYGFNLNALTTNTTWKASENSGGAAPIGNQGFETSAITIGVGSALTNGDGTISVDIYYRELNL